jgi:hypothetical protein
MVVRNGEDEWVSEKGTARIMSLAEEPYSQNEMGEQDGGTAETTQSADQREAATPESAVATLGNIVQNVTGTESARKSRMVMYAAAALVGISLFTEVL